VREKQNLPKRKIYLEPSLVSDGLNGAECPRLLFLSDGMSGTWPLGGEVTLRENGNYAEEDNAIALYPAK
jgi:hypothetical protein